MSKNLRCRYKACKFTNVNCAMLFWLIIFALFREATSRYSRRMKWINETRSLECDSRDLWRPGRARYPEDVGYPSPERGDGLLYLHIHPSLTSSPSPQHCFHLRLLVIREQGFTRSNWLRSVSLGSRFDRQLETCRE